MKKVSDLPLGSEEYYQAFPQYRPEACEERRKRIHLSVYAYAYEFENVSLISDEKYDTLSKLINPQVSTGNETLDEFFRTQFEPDTGMWIRSHPELDKVMLLYEHQYKGKVVL